VVRKRFGMLLDLAFIEEAQISVLGRRGGGRSRAGYGENSFEYAKNLFYAPAGVPARSSHSKVMETSRYQLPAAAILLRHAEFPAPRPLVIANRVLGELAPEPAPDGAGTAYAADSALVNYAYRTPHYLLGSTLQHPGLTYTDPETGEPVLRYAGISRQNRWCGMLFHDPHARHPLVPANRHRTGNEPAAIYPVVEQTRGGRPQHPHWSFQHENVLLLQRIGRQHGGVGSYSTGKMGIRFHGKGLEKVEESGWIFAGNGNAFAAVRFLDHEYQWDDTGEEAGPAHCNDPACTSRILLHAGDATAHGPFDEFRRTVLRSRLTVERDKVEYRPAPEGTLIEFFRYDVEDPDAFALPRAGGQPVELRPEWIYRSPYLQGRFGSDRITVRVGGVKQVYDFAESAVRDR
jgi:hypothetical protein